MDMCHLSKKYTKTRRAFPFVTYIKAVSPQFYLILIIRTQLNRFEPWPSAKALIDCHAMLLTR